MRFTVLLAAFSLVVTAAHAQKIDPWLTFYEQSGYTKTPRYGETIAYCKRLASASPWVHYEPFGTSPQGRDLPLVVVSRDRVFTPREAAKSGKAVLLIQSGIHAGEIDGKDASLMLIRDIAIRKTLAPLLDHTILLFVPIFNVDGHERFGPYNRINQNGPEEMGWRVTAQNLNLNRDYMKADAPEMRAMLRLYSAWLPDLYVDCHVTDGIDFQYDVTYTMETGPNIDTGIAQWITTGLLPTVLPEVEASGHGIFPYVFPREDRDLSRGILGGASTARFSTGYAALQNRPALLIETHMLKPYRVRVSATYELLKSVIACVNRSPRSLREAVRKADSATVATGRSTGGTLPLTYALGADSVMVDFRGVASTIDTGMISGAPYPVYASTPEQVSIPYFSYVKVTDSIAIPRAYLIPPEWQSVRDVLLMHGIVVQRLAKPLSVDVESYRLSKVKFGGRPYEGRQGVTFRADTIHQRRLYPAGSYLVRTDQRAAKVAIHLLEPRSPDSFVSWGFFNAIFEQKEYAETYVMEKVGKRLFEEHPELREEFEAALAADTVFAHNAAARVNWVYQRSPWRDASLNVYPVGRLMSDVPMPGAEPLKGR